MSNTDKKTLAQEFVRKATNAIQQTKGIHGQGWKWEVRKILEPLRAEGKSFDDVDDADLIKTRTSVLRALAVCYHGTNEADKKRSALDECIDLDPDDPLNWIALGRYLHYKGQNQEALGCLARVVSGVGRYAPLDSNNLVAWSETAKICESMGNKEGLRLANETIAKIKQNPPETKFSLMKLSYMYHDQGLPDKQIECLERIVYGTPETPPIDGRDIRARIALASMYWKTNQHLKALACAEPIVKGDDAINPQDASAWHFLSELNDFLRNTEESARCHANAVKYGHVSAAPRREPR